MRKPIHFLIIFSYNKSGHKDDKPMTKEHLQKLNTYRMLLTECMQVDSMFWAWLIQCNIFSNEDMQSIVVSLDLKNFCFYINFRYKIFIL